MRRTKNLIRKLAHRCGVEISRYPREDLLFRPWIDQLQRGGPVECVLDVGANRAQTVARFRSCFPNCTIYAFEPSEAAYRELIKATGGDTKVRSFHSALGERDGTATLYENAADVTNSLLPNSVRSGEFAPTEMCKPVGESTVPMMRLDTFCAQERIPRIDILKIDTQGYERRILDGAGALLAPEFVRGIFLEVVFVDLYQGQAWGSELIELLRSCGYKLFGFTEIAFDHINGWKWADAMFLPDRPVR